ncbi:MAG: polysaccharide biosynthesis C-terminal domain-containing protein, partial [Actinobacteria bacterium]|nr:polysaccharide biosynthesis C-terminal domain-containing protein [Actinomycetota bacterium]
AGLSARGRPGLRSAALVIACPINVGLVFLLVPHQGAMGAAIATLAGALVASNLVIYFTWRHFQVSPLDFYGLRRSDVAAMIRFSRRLLARLRNRPPRPAQEGAT